MAMAQSTLADVKGALARTLGKLATEKPDFGQVLAPLWADAVGAGLARHSRPISLQDGLLLIELGPEFAADIERESATICSRLNKRMGSNAVLSIRYLANHSSNNPLKP